VAGRKVFHDSIFSLGSKDVPPPKGFTVETASDDDLDRSLTLQFVIDIGPEKRRLLDDSIAKSKVLAPEELFARFGANEFDVTALLQWLSVRGYEIIEISRDRASVYVTASARVISETLNLTMARVTVDGTTYVAALDPPSLPAEIGRFILAIVGLQPFLGLKKGLRWTSGDSPTKQTTPAASGGQPPYLVSEIRKAYSADHLGADGSNQAIAILIDTFPTDTDLRGFWQANGLPADTGRITRINVKGGPLPPLDMEETLDAEWSSGIAPGAEIRIYATGSLTFVDLNLGLDRIISDCSTIPGLRQMSISLGQGELFLGGIAGIINAQHAKFVQLAATGVNVFVSSGDGGSNPDQNNQPIGPLQVQYPSSDPCVIAVGGTSLRLDTNGNTTSETAWDRSGGGVSTLFARPSWQVGNDLPQGASRLVPDVSAAADPATGAYLYYKGAATSTGGTSWSAPVWAGLCALINQMRTSRGLSALPYLNPVWFGFRSQGRFRDIVSGSNGNYSAQPNYDRVTGLGTPLMNKLVQSLASGTLVVNPASDITASGLAGGAFTPASFKYTVQATSGQIDFVISGAPAWLTVSPPAGTATTAPLTVTFTINDSVARTYPPSTVGPTTIEFLNSSIGPVPMIAAKLTVKGPNIIKLPTPTAMFQERAWGGSLDTHIVVGEGWRVPNGSLIGAVVWTNNVAATLEYPPGIAVESTDAKGCDRSGTIVVGNGYTHQGTTYALRWRRGHVEVLKPLPGQTGSRAIAASADGKIVVGYSGTNVVRWLNDYVDPEPVAPPFIVQAMSADGTVIAGFEEAGRKPVQWAYSGGQYQKTFLDLASGYTGAIPYGISADGKVIAGTAFEDQSGQGKQRAVYWKSGSMTVLEPLAQAPNSHGFVVASKDNSIVIFGARNIGGLFRWTNRNGIELVSDLAAGFIDLSQWYLERPTAISSDGSAISGLGQYPPIGQNAGYHPFVLELPVPA
jgi:kumamolisin